MNNKIDQRHNFIDKWLFVLDKKVYLLYQISIAMKRRQFFKFLSMGGATLAIKPIINAANISGAIAQDKPIETNISDALKVPRNENSMPGKYPGKVVKIIDNKSVVDGVPQEDIAYTMLENAMLTLTGAASIESAWREFVSPEDIIGLKVNPVAGRLLTTSHAVTKSVIKQLVNAGIPKENIVIWDRREMQLHETGYDNDNYPGITITGTECMDQNGGFYDNDGNLYSMSRIDKDQYYYADIEGEYDDYTIPYMVNGGKYSYFSKICTDQVTKIINIPILKNTGRTTTLALKNLSFGAVTNTGRLHKIFHDCCAEICAFPPLRDKVVLNIADGLIGCFDGGPSAKPQFICNYNMIFVGTDPVAVDRVGHNVIVNKRIAMGVQTEDLKNASRFLDNAQKLGLGVSDNEKINLIEKIV